MSKYRKPYTIFKRGKYWYYRTYDIAGIRTTAHTTGQTSKSAAQAYCDNLFLTGALWQTNMTFGEYAFNFYDDNSPYVKDRVEPLAENTLRGIRNKMKNYILPYFSNMKLADIKYTTLKEFRIKMLEKYSVSNTISTMSTLKHIFDSAFRDRLIPVNPYSYLEPMNAKPNEKDAFTFNEVKTLYTIIPEEFKKTILLMALTGMRISEAVGVLPEDFKTDNEILYIDLVKQFNLKKYKPLKRKSIRKIPVIPEIKDLIGFDHTRLSAFYREYVAIKSNFENVDERNLSFHSLRHFFITNAKSKGVISSKVEYLAGHSLKKQEKVYTQYNVDDLKEIIPWQEETYKLLLNYKNEGLFANDAKPFNYYYYNHCD